MTTEKDRLMRQLKNFIESETAYLTREDIDNVTRIIDELDKKINCIYRDRLSANASTGIIGTNSASV